LPAITLSFVNEMGNEMFGFALKHDVDLGQLLTFVTLVAGFFWWIYTTIRSWRQKSYEEARSGVLRLILKILRDHGAPMSLNALWNEFGAPENKKLRKTYCRRNWKFKNLTQLEAAVYRLDFEGKTAFVSGNDVVFRLDRYASGDRNFIPADSDATHLLNILREAGADPKVNLWDFEKLAQSCCRVASKEGAALLREMLQSGDSTTRRHAAAVLGSLVPNQPEQSQFDQHQKIIQ
jgi:hypothetical protein